MRVLIVLLVAAGVFTPPAMPRDAVQLVVPGELAGPAKHGIVRLLDVLEDRGVTVEVLKAPEDADAPHVIMAGLASWDPAARRIAAGGLAVPSRAEALAVRSFRDGDRRVLVLCGADGAGLMYAALDAAERMGWAAPGDDLFAHVRDTSEAPFLTDRSVSTYTMQRRLFEQRLHDATYWRDYFDLLARSRINSYVIIFGYENGGFMAPAYPYFFNVEGFPGVELYGMTEEQQARNTAALRRVIELAHERGIRFTAGIWDHIYRGGVQAGGIEGASKLAGKKAPNLVHGVTARNLAPYTKAALKKFLGVFPHIDGIQFRMHWESGLTRKETPGFWHDVLSMLRTLNPRIRIDLRAKGLPDEVIEDAVAQGLPFRITTKYWMEQLGMPFHPTHINPQNQRDRRHGYADLLRYPKRYGIDWRVWSGGTARFLLWGDPQYVRRFVRSARIYGGRSFEVNEMLATKMLGQPHDERPFDLLTPAYRHYRYEFERYWHYYQVWGRIAYDPDAPAELWQREFVGRFGAEAGPEVMEALHAASNILPRIVAASYNYRYFPTTRGWAEVMRLGDLPRYAKGTGTDVEQFQSYAEAARDLLAGRFTSRRTPLQTSRWFREVSARVLAGVEKAAAAAGDLRGAAAREFLATAADLRILAHLARYHAARARAAIWYNVYRETKDRFALERCLAGESGAIDEWKKIIESAGDVYPETLKFGVRRVGFSWHWKEELPRLQAGLEELRKLPAEERLDEKTRQRLLRQEAEASAPPALSVEVDRIASARPGRDLTVTAAVKGSAGPASVRLRYRHVTQFEDYRTIEMRKEPATGRFAASIPGSFIVPAWDLMYFVEAMPERGPGRNAPDLGDGMPYVIVPVERKVVLEDLTQERLAAEVRRAVDRGERSVKGLWRAIGASVAPFEDTTPSFNGNATEDMARRKKVW